MALPPITILSAGAGSGKTYRIQKEIAGWIERGLVSPEKVAAVTFTEAAASELQERIREELIGRRNLDAALRLDAAQISTIHSFELRLITEFAFDAGISPALRLLNEDEEEIFIRQALSRAAKLEPMIQNLPHYGFAYKYGNGSSSESSFRAEGLHLVSLLRSLGAISDKRRQSLVREAEREIRKVYGPVTDGEMLRKELTAAVKALLKQFPTPLARPMEQTKRLKLICEVTLTLYIAPLAGSR
jgi:hypothetical protein